MNLFLDYLPAALLTPIVVVVVLSMVYWGMLFAEHARAAIGDLSVKEGAPQTPALPHLIVKS